MNGVKDINRKLKDRAIACGLCNEWQHEWISDWDLEKMVSQFYRGLDFYLKTRFIQKDFFKNYFKIDFRRQNGVLADDTYSLLNPEQAVLIGNSESTIRVNGFKASSIYVLDDSKVKIVAKNRSFVIVHALDNAKVNAHQYDMARLVVIKHSHNVSVSSEGNTTIKEEFDYLQ